MAHQTSTVRAPWYLREVQIPGGRKLVYSVVLVITVFSVGAILVRGARIGPLWIVPTTGISMQPLAYGGDRVIAFSVKGDLKPGYTYLVRCEGTLYHKYLRAVKGQMGFFVSLNNDPQEGNVHFWAPLKNVEARVVGVIPLHWLWFMAELEPDQAVDLPVRWDKLSVPEKWSIVRPTVIYSQPPSEEEKVLTLIPGVKVSVSPKRPLSGIVLSGKGRLRIGPHIIVLEKAGWVSFTPPIDWCFSIMLEADGARKCRLLFMASKPQAAPVERDLSADSVRDMRDIAVPTPCRIFVKGTNLLPATPQAPREAVPSRVFLFAPEKVD